MEEKREGEEKVKEITTSILDVKKEMRAQVQNNPTQNNNHNHNNRTTPSSSSWFRPRDKFGKFISTSTSHL